MSDMFQVKLCKRCSIEKPLYEYHRQPSGPMGHHSWCKPCANAYARASRIKHTTPAQRRQWNLRTKYGISMADLAAMLEAQGNLCAICRKVMTKPKVDHDHQTGVVRGVLCHRCNLKLAGVEDATFLAKALDYLNGSP